MDPLDLTDELNDLSPPTRKRGVGATVVLTLLLLATLGGAGYGGYRLYNELQSARADAAAASDRLHRAQVGFLTIESHSREADQGLAAAHARVQELEAQVAASDARAHDAEEQLATARSAAASADATHPDASPATPDAHSQETAALAARLRNVVGNNAGETHAEANGEVSFQLVDRVLFATGESELTPEGIAVLRQVAEVMRSVPDKQIWIEGHTDVAAVPHPERFPTNWELSTARALSVVHFLQDQEHIDPRRLAAVGFGQYRPLSRRQGARNRRIEIVLLPQTVHMVQR